jgi:hypothetical protein
MRQPRVTHIARCPEHGLHGERAECFVCRGPVTQVAMVELSPMLDLIKRLTSAEGELLEDAEAQAITLLRAHGRLG